MVDVIKFIPEKAGIEADDTHVVIWDQKTGSGGRSPTQQLLRNIDLSPRTVEFFARYLGDGRTSPNGRIHISYTSIDTGLVKKHIDDVEELFGIGREQQRIYFHVPPGEQLQDRVRELNVQQNQIKRYLGKRHKNISITAQYGNSLVAPTFVDLIHSILEKDVLNSQEQHVAFLKGLFAAEGCVMINSRVGCLVALEFTLHREEYRLQAQLQRSLESLEIEYSMRDIIHTNARATTITGWKNYAVCWSLGVLDGCIRKKHSFYEQLIRTDLHAEVSDVFKTAIRGSWESIQELSRYVAVSYNRLLYWFDGTTTLTVNELIGVATASGFTCDSVCDNITAIRARVSDDIVAEGFLNLYWDSLVSEGVIPN